MTYFESVEDDIAEIESSAYMSHNKGTANKNSSMGSVDTFNSKDYEKGDLVCGFPSQPQPLSSSIEPSAPNRFSTANLAKPKQRNSISINPMCMRSTLNELADLVDSDDEDDGGKAQPIKKAPAPTQLRRNSLVAPTPISNRQASGGPDHRPLVGGFAAAAYEAARVDHYKQQGVGVRGHHEQRFPHRAHYPRYPGNGMA